MVESRLSPSFGRRVVAALVLLSTAAACDGRSARDALRLRPASPHERYAQSLRDAGLADAALGRDWSAAAERALSAPLAVALPYRESGYFAPTEAGAVGLRVHAGRGQRLTVRLESEPGPAFAIFADLFELRRDSTGAPTAAPRLAASADDAPAAGPPAAAPTSAAVGRDDVDYVLRLQPELLRGGRYTVTIEAGPTLRFPVAGKGAKAVQSYFGADRDAGARRHEGVDIFAARGTPVVAATDGIVRGLGNTALGGKVVWLWDVGHGQALYYAHLDSQIAHPGQLVRPGDTLGLVGNTGNARTTPPHLHFGVYVRGRGAVDPFPFIDPRAPAPPPPAADASSLGALRRVAARAGAPFVARAAASGEGGRGSPAGGTERTLPAETLLRVDGAAGPLYRVRLPDGTAGFVAARLTEPADRATATLTAARVAGATRRAGDPHPAELALRDRPLPTAAVVESVAPRAPLEVLGRYGDYLLVRTEGRREGWVEGVR